MIVVSDTTPLISDELKADLLLMDEAKTRMEIAQNMWLEGEHNL